jgi:hypothetical protein
MIKNREGHVVQLLEITKVDPYEESVAITTSEGFTFNVGNEELDGFSPHPGDTLVLTTRNFSTILGIIIEGRVIRRKSEAQFQVDHEQWKKNLRLERLEQYLKHGPELKARAEALLPPLRDRMQRFAKESGEEFWIESASYEMYALEGANALLIKTEGMEPESAIKWIKEWWDINSDRHDPPYDYKKQMELVPDFGDGHSGNTASAATSIAIAVLEGKSV